MKKSILLFLLSLPLFLNATNYTWDKAKDYVLINNSVFGPLQAGDTVFIPARAGGYKSHSYDQLHSGAGYSSLSNGTGYIVVYWQPGAFITPGAADDYSCFMDNCIGLKIYGLTMSHCGNMAWRLGNNQYGPDRGVPHGYSSWICIDSAKFIASAGMPNFVTGSLKPFAGDTNNMYHHWWIRNCIFDSTSASLYGGATAIQFGQISNNGYWRDIEISGCIFDHYSSGTTTASVYINLLNVWGAKIHNNIFRNLGMLAHPAGHAVIINMDIGGQIYIYNNIFGPNNFANEFRLKGASLQLKGWNGRSRFYNNIVFDKRKYPVVENQTVNPGILATLSPYVIARSGPEVYNNTVYNLSAGVGNSPYIVALYDNYANDTVTIKNNILTQVRDTIWANINPRIVAFSYGRPVFLDTSSNKSVQLFANAGIMDKNKWIPSANGILYNAGAAVPSWLTTDFYGNPRNINGRVDIGAVENTIQIQPKKKKSKK
jgi:hypothetical protein